MKAISLLPLAALALGLAACSGATVDKGDDTPDMGQAQDAQDNANNNQRADLDNLDANNGANHGAGGGLVLNEVAAAGDPEDWIEIYNASDQPVALSDLWMTDDPEGEPFKGAFEQGAALLPGQYLVVYLSDDYPGFKLGKDEAFALFDNDGQRLDGTDWEEGGSPEGGSWARLPNLTGDFATTWAPTPGAPNQAAEPPDMGEPDTQGPDLDPPDQGEDMAEPDLVEPVPGDLVLNEVAAAGDPEDWIEVYHQGQAPLDLSGWTLSDDPEAAPDKGTFPEGMILQPGQYVVISLTDEWPGFKLGKDEQIALFTPDGQEIQSADWEDGDSPEGGSWARIPDLTGDFRRVDEATPGAENALP